MIELTLLLNSFDYYLNHYCSDFLSNIWMIAKCVYSNEFYSKIKSQTALEEGDYKAAIAYTLDIPQDSKYYREACDLKDQANYRLGRRHLVGQYNADYETTIMYFDKVSRSGKLSMRAKAAIRIARIKQENDLRPNSDYPRTVFVDGIEQYVN